MRIYLKRFRLFFHLVVNYGISPVTIIKNREVLLDTYHFPNK